MEIKFDIDQLTDLDILGLAAGCAALSIQQEACGYSKELSSQCRLAQVDLLQELERRGNTEGVAQYFDLVGKLSPQFFDDMRDEMMDRLM